jgi:hypothetical protein
MSPRSEDTKLLKKRARAENPYSVEVACKNISSAPSYTSVFAHIVILVILDCAQEVIGFMSNAPAAQ